jgi:pimeloyl-ACP methyl ester carboxylesterase
VFSETDQTEDLKAIEVPTLVLHGDDDQIVRIAASAQLSAKIVKKAVLKVYECAPHGMCTTHNTTYIALSTGDSFRYPPRSFLASNGARFPLPGGTPCDPPM